MHDPAHLSCLAYAKVDGFFLLFFLVDKFFFLFAVEEHASQHQLLLGFSGERGPERGERGKPKCQPSPITSDGLPASLNITCLNDSLCVAPTLVMP